MTALFIRQRGDLSTSAYLVETAEGLFRVPPLAGGWQYRRAVNAVRDHDWQVDQSGRVRTILEWLGVPAEEIHAQTA